MQITIKLKDPKSCEECPLIHSEYDDYGGLWEACCLEYDYDGITFERPTKCIEENGQ